MGSYTPLQAQNNIILLYKCIGVTYDNCLLCVYQKSLCFILLVDLLIICFDQYKLGINVI